MEVNRSNAYLPSHWLEWSHLILPHLDRLPLLKTFRFIVRADTWVPGQYNGQSVVTHDNWILLVTRDISTGPREGRCIVRGGRHFYCCLVFVCKCMYHFECTCVWVANISIGSWQYRSTFSVQSTHFCQAYGMRGCSQCYWCDMLSWQGATWKLIRWVSGLVVLLDVLKQPPCFPQLPSSIMQCSSSHGRGLVPVWIFSRPCSQMSMRMKKTPIQRA